MNFGRLATAMITPFTPEGTIDWPRVSSMIEYLIQQGNDAIVVAGTTGESPTLTNEEKVELYTYAVREAAGRVHVIAGTGGNNTEAAIQLTKQAEEAGVDGVMLVAPFYNKPSQEGLYQHFKKIAEATSLPVMLYNIPGRSAVNITVDTMVRLTEIDNIVAIKEASGDLVQVTELAARKPEHVRIYSGNDELLVPTMAVGGYGVVSVASQLISPEMKKMMEAFVAGDVTTATQMHQRYLPLVKALFITSSPAPLKYALSKRGVCEPTLRLPLVPPTEEEKKVIDKLVEELVPADRFVK